MLAVRGSTGTDTAFSPLIRRRPFRPPTTSLLNPVWWCPSEETYRLSVSVTRVPERKSISPPHTNPSAMLSPSAKKAARSPQQGVTSGAGTAEEPGVVVANDREEASSSRNSNNHTPESAGGILEEIRKRELENAVSNSVLSPHNSVFEALHNPDLNRGVDLSTIKSKVVGHNTHLFHSASDIDTTTAGAAGAGASTPEAAASGSQYHFQFNQDLNDKNNLNFSITSWQNVSSYFSQNDETRSSSRDSNSQFAFNLASNNNSNIISSGNNSPYLKNDDTFCSNSPNRVDSPNVASILSCFSSQDDQKSIDDNPIVEMKTQVDLTHETLTSDSDPELDHTVDSSTIISSFVMPRVSIHSNLAASQQQQVPSHQSTSSSSLSPTYSDPVLVTRSRLNIRIVGDKHNSLMKRFKSYKKTFTNIDFFVTNCESTDLILLVLDDDNYMLPKITKTPCIPITLSKQALETAKKIPKYLKLCDPIALNSLDDDLIILVDFLSNINDLSTWRMFLSAFPIKSHSPAINDINSSLIEFHSENKSGSENFLVSMRRSGYTPKNNKDDHNKQPYNTFLIAGVAVGLLSIGIIFVWKKLATKEFVQQNSTKQIPNLPYESIVVDPIDDSKMPLDQYLFSKLKSIAISIESWGDVVFSQGVFLFQKAKLVLIELLNF